MPAHQENGHDRGHRPLRHRADYQRRPARRGLAAAQAVPGAAGFAPCKPWREVVANLGSRYAERPVAFGLQANGSLLQVFASERTGTWTLVTMHPNGTACLIGAGSSWESLPEPSTDPAA